MGMSADPKLATTLPMHAAYNETARALGLPETTFELTPDEDILHYRYLAHEVYKLRNFLTLNFGQFEGPAIPHAIEMLRILGKIETPPPKPHEEDPQLVKERVKAFLRETFLQPVLMDMLVCVDNLVDRFGVSRALASQYLIEVIKEGGIRQLGHYVCGRGKEPVLETAMALGPMTKTRLVETLAKTFNMGADTMCEALDDAIKRAYAAGFNVERKGPLISVGPIIVKPPKKKLKKKKK